MNDVKQIRALCARGLRGGLNEEESFHLCELVVAFMASESAFIDSLIADMDEILAEGLECAEDTVVDVKASINCRAADFAPN